MVITHIGPPETEVYIERTARGLVGCDVYLDIKNENNLEMFGADLIKGSLYSLRGRYITKATFGSVVTYVHQTFALPDLKHKLELDTPSYYSQ